MAAKFKVGDLVWAKMKGFQTWPGKVIENHTISSSSSVPKTTLGSRRTMSSTTWSCETSTWALIAYLAASVKTVDLPSIDEEIAQIFPEKSGSQKDYSREPLAPKKERKSLDPKRSKPRSRPSGSSKVGRPKSEGAVSNHKDSDDIYRLPDDDEMDDHEPLESYRKSQKQRELGKKPKPSPSSRKSLPVKRAAPLPTASGDYSPASGSSAPKQHKFFVSKAASATTSVDQDQSFNRSSYDSAHDGPLPRYKDEASEARLSPEDGRIPADDEDTFGMTEEEKTQDSYLNKMASKAVIPTPLRIGFLGLGIMGQGMVMNLLRSGHEVTVWNRTAQKVGL
ncbi:hypothetical protein BaRGS_00021806, partial [Batillaria attramentaria]